MIVFGTDFDDTLYFHDGRHLRPQDAQAIRRLQQAGDQFGLVSGRARVLWPVVEQMIEGQVNFDFKIYSNGSCICDGQNTVLAQWFMPENSVRDIFARYKDVGLILHGENALYLTTIQGPELPGVMVKSIEEFDPSRIYAISFNHRTQAGRKVWQESQARKDVIVVSNSRYTDFGPLETSKGRALNYIAHTLYSPKDMSAAIGDSYNDQSMLEEADISFTFHSSPEEVKESATHCVNGIDEAVDWLLTHQQQ